MKWLREILCGGLTRLPEAMTETVIPVDIDIGDRDQLVLVARSPLSEDQVDGIRSAWDSGVESGKPVILVGGFDLKVIRNLRRPAK